MDAENVGLCGILDEAEIRSVISSLGLHKALGPDGFTGLIFKTFWYTIRISVINLVQKIFRNGFMLKELNHTHLTLIPKVKILLRCPILGQIVYLILFTKSFPRF